MLREWAMPGKDLNSRQAAISALAHVDKSNKEITNQIAGYLAEQHAPIRYTTVFALGTRGDASAIPALEAMLKRDDLSIEMAPTIKEQIARLKNPSAKGNPSMWRGDEDEEAQGEERAEKPGQDQRLTQIEQLVKEMNERLKTIESRLPAARAHKIVKRRSGFWLSKENAEVAQVVSGRASDDGIVKPVEKRVGIASAEEICGIRSRGSGASKSLAIGNGARRWAVSINAVRPHAEDGDVAAGDPLDAGKDKRGVTPADAITGDG